MGYVRVRARVWNVEDPSRCREVELLAGTRAIYTVLPASLLMELGVKPVGNGRFRLTNNQVIERDIGIVGIEIQGMKTHTIAVFGNENIYLLGIVTLEELGLEINPVKGGLRPMKPLLM